MNDELRDKATQIAEKHGLRVVKADSLVAQFRKSGWTQQNHRNGINLLCHGQAIAACGGRRDFATEERRTGWLAASAWCFENGVTTAEKVAVEAGLAKAHEVRPVRKDKNPQGRK